MCQICGKHYLTNPVLPTWQACLMLNLQMGLHAGSDLLFANDAEVVCWYTCWQPWRIPGRGDGPWQDGAAPLVAALLRLVTKRSAVTPFALW